MAETDPWEFEHLVRRSVHQAAHITTVRVQNMKVLVERNEGFLYVSFTIVDWPSYLNKTHDSRIPPESVLPLSEALENLKSNISAEALKIVIPGAEVTLQFFPITMCIISILSQGSEPFEVVAVKNYFETGNQIPTPSTDSDGKKYSPGKDIYDNKLKYYVMQTHL